VRLERPVRAVDDYGQGVTTWELVKYLWAEISPMRGDEAILARVPTGTVSHRITTRWTGEVPDNAWRIVFNGRTFQITERTNWLERNIMLDIMAKEILA
jgi:SPP1 family predicted phage head-tail adaptor